MNHQQPGSLANYNSLTDKHLAGYFSNSRIRRHLLRSGLISRSGRIIPEKEYQLNAMRKDHQKYIRECLAQAIFHKVLDMERHHQLEIKRKLENSARRERVQRIKVERSRKATEETNHQLSPHPPTAPRNRFGRRKLGNRGQSVHLATCPRPSTAPGNMQHPLRLQPLYGNITTESASKANLSTRTKFLTLEKELQFPCAGDKGASKPMLSIDYSSGISPYRFPIINNYMIPIPPPPKSEKNINTAKGVTSRGRRLRPTTAPNGLEQLLIRDTGRFYRPQVHSNACVTMIYLGKTVHLSYDLFDYREEVKVYQQHCGGENLCVFKGKLLEGESFQFISRRHYGFPFSLTFYLNGIQVDRLSSCCEYKHRKGTRLGGKHGHFGFINVERSAPCYRCIIAMGLDKKPSPPKKKVADEEESRKEDSERKDAKEGLSERHGIREESQDPQSSFSSADKEGKQLMEGPEEMEWESRKGATQKTSNGSEKDQRSAASDAYDEDFEADEEKSDGKVNEEGQAEDQMNGTSKSPSDDEKDNLGHERKHKNSSQKALRASDSEQDESDGYVESDSEGEDKQGTKRAPSPSSSSTPYLSENISDVESRRQDGEQDNMDVPSEYDSETKSPRVESQETDMEEDSHKTEYPTARRTPEVSYGRQMERNLQDTSSLRGKLSPVGLLDVDVREEREADELVHFRGRRPEGDARGQVPSEDEEGGESKSAKEKIAEAIEQDQFLSSEPEPSDSSTEDEEDTVATRDKQEETDGASLAEKPKGPKSQAVAEQVEQERQMAGKERALKEEETLDHAGPQDAALGDQFQAKHVVTLTAKRAGKDQLVREEAEQEKEAEVESDVDHEEEEEMHGKVKPPGREIKAEERGREPQEMLSEHDISDGEETPGGYELEGEEIEGQSVEREEQATRETLPEALRTGGALKTAIVGETKTKRNGTLPAQEPGTEGVVEMKLTGTEEEHAEGSKDVEINLREASVAETDSKAKGRRISMDEKGVASEKLVEEDDSLRKVPFDVEESILKGPCMSEGDLGKISPETSKMKNKSTEDVSAAEVLTHSAGEQSLNHLDTEMVTLTKEDAMKGQEDKLHSGGKLEDPTLKTTSETKEARQQDENTEEAVEDETEQGMRVEMLKSGMRISEGKLRFGKEELFAAVVPEALPFATEESIRNAEAKRKEAVKGEAEAEEAERKMVAEEKVKDEGTKSRSPVEGDEEDEEIQRLLTVKWKRKDEDSESEGEILSLVTESEGEPSSEMTIVRWQNVVNMEGDILTDAKDVPESSVQKETLTGGLNKEEEMENESDVQEELEETPEETEQASVYMKVQDEEVTDEDENGDEGSDTEEQVTGEGITLADVEEALLIGIQQFITEVSRMNEDVEDKEEEPLVEDLAEEMSNHKGLDREDFSPDVTAEERWQTESNKVDERGIVDRNPLEGNDGRGKKKTRQEESPEEDQAGTEFTQWGTEPSEGGKH